LTTTSSTIPPIEVVPSQVTLMDRLRQETGELHRAAERCDFQRSLVKGEITPGVLAAWFDQLLPVHRALERALRAARSDEPWTETFKEDQSRERDLLADLDVLQSDAAAGEMTASTTGQPPPATAAFIDAIGHIAAGPHPAALLGVLYVLEGSNNGSKFIARAIRRAWNWSDDRRLRYLDPYGERLGERWQQFRNEVNALSCAPAQEQAIIEAAKRTFQAIHAMSLSMIAHENGESHRAGPDALEQVS
jgi:heme oxygenase